MIGIYKITHKASGKSYIGQSVDVRRRILTHKAVARNRKRDAAQVITRAIRKYGVEAFTYELLEECSEEDLTKREQYYIDKYKTYVTQNGYNVANPEELKSGIDAPLLKLTDKQVKEIHKHLKAGRTTKYLVEKYKVSRGLISLINTGDAYGWIESEHYPIADTLTASLKARGHKVNGENYIKYDTCACGKQKLKISQTCRGCIPYTKTYYIAEDRTIPALGIHVDDIVEEVSRYGYNETARSLGISQNTLSKLLKDYLGYTNTPYAFKNNYKAIKVHFKTLKKEYSYATIREFVKGYAQLTGMTEAKIENAIYKSINSKNKLHNEFNKLEVINNELHIHINELQRYVEQYTTTGLYVRKYKTQADAVRSVTQGKRIKSTRMVNCLKGRVPTAYGYYWQYGYYIKDYLEHLI